MTDSLADRITDRLTADGSAIISPRMARWLEEQAGMTADRRIRLRDNDPDAYIALTALHLAALRSDCGTNHATAQPNSADLTMWMSTSQAAHALGVTDRCVRKWCRTGRLRAVLTSHRYLIDPHSLHLQNIA